MPEFGVVSSGLEFPCSCKGSAQMRYSVFPSARSPLLANRRACFKQMRSSNTRVALSSAEALRVQCEQHGSPASLSARKRRHSAIVKGVGGEQAIRIICSTNGLKPVVKAFI